MPCDFAVQSSEELPPCNKARCAELVTAYQTAADLEVKLRRKTRIRRDAQ